MTVLDSPTKDAPLHLNSSNKLIDYAVAITSYDLFHMSNNSFTSCRQGFFRSGVEDKFVQPVFDDYGYHLSVIGINDNPSRQTLERMTDETNLSLRLS